jgi:(4-(4-[2-(gamma-L-glutamylamino)ethyl]phenoxymethyl)furan-2-yl)methanamine synthase
VSDILGWDVGGAHLKVARLRDGCVVEVRQVACALWQGLDRLDQAMEAALTGWPDAVTHALTMTGELSDVFADRASGVRAIVAALARRLGDAAIGVYTVDGAFVSPDGAASSPECAASANWHATAQFAALQEGNGLVVDVGSTTTDLVPLKDGMVAAQGKDDGERLARQELVYRGVVRTPVMAVADHVLLDGRRVGLTAELFASMADVYRLTGELPAHADLHPAADGRGKSPVESRARLARMIGRDRDSAPDEIWDALARQLAERVEAALAAASEHVLAAAGVAENAVLIGAGVGRFLAVKLARRLGRPYRGFEDLITAVDARCAAMAADSAPAVAVALLMRGAASRAARSRDTASVSSGPLRRPVVSAERKPR